MSSRHKHIALKDSRTRFSEICRKNGLPLTDLQLHQLSGYADALLYWNAKINLISRSQTDTLWFSHILHSVSALFIVEVPTGMTILDLGTGAGLPGIPLAVLRPDLKITLLDSIKKKTMAIQRIVQSISLINVEVLTGRAEELARSEALDARFDIVVSRAVAPLNDLIKWCKPLVRNAGSISDAEATRLETGKLARYSTPYLMAYKGGDLEDEIRDAKLRTGEKAISIKSIIFVGSADAGLEGKKLVFVEF